MIARFVALMLLLSPVWTSSPMMGNSLLWAEEPPQPAVDGGRSGTEPAPVIMKEASAMAEGSNKCEIVSCGMGIKETCQITCPGDKTPKCSCDCARNFGPICMEYKANCRCE